MSHRTVPHIYVAGPYSAYPIYGIRNAILAGDEVLAAGMYPHIPHFTGIWDLVSPKPYEDWLNLDLEAVRICDAILRLPGESSGADGEVEFGASIGIPTFYSLEDLIVWRDSEWVKS